MAIEANYREHNRWYVEKLLRFSQVRREISAESAKETLDALAMGVRAVELSTICREVRERADQVQERNLSLVPLIASGQRWLVSKDSPSISAVTGPGTFDSPSVLSLTGCSDGPFPGGRIPVATFVPCNSAPEPEQK